MRIDRILAVTLTAVAVLLGASMLRPDGVLAVPAGAALAATTTPLPLDRDDPGRDRIGKLKFLGAVQIRSTDPLFGGVSALRAGPGLSMLAITDTGNWFAFDTVEAGDRLTGIANAVLMPILQPGGRPAATKTEGDAEALDWDPASGAATIVFEQDHRLAQFTGIDPKRPATLAKAPARVERLTQMTGWPLNGGGEAVAILADGTRIVIGEDALTADGSHVALVTRAGVTSEIGIAGVPGHKPTDAVALDDHRILVLHREFGLMGQGAAITLVDLGPALATGPRVLPAQLLAQWSPPVTLDNMEGLAIRRSGERIFLYVISDDNLNSLQRTLLMKFELVA